MVRHNHIIPNEHFHKKWQLHVKVRFNQAMKKQRRKAIRKKKYLDSVPKPIEPLRPMVHCPTQRYNSKLRVGRGFTLQELELVGVNGRMAKSRGVPVDYRRRNRSVKSLEANYERLKKYFQKLILFPQKNKKEFIVKIDSGKNLNKKKLVQPKTKIRVVSEKEKNFEAFVTLRKTRANGKFVGIRNKKKLSKGNFEFEK